MATDKKIFAVIGATHPDQLRPKIEAGFPESNLSVGPGQWFIIGPSTMTTQELSTKLELLQPSTPENTSSAIVVSVNSYFGRAPVNIWEWLVAKMGDASAVAG
jgi:sarcosine oxidase gamma subunit